MIPYPQYPLYSATLALVGGTVVPYFPDEKKNWQIDPDHLEDVLQQVCHPFVLLCNLRFTRAPHKLNACSVMTVYMLLLPSSA